MFSRGGLAVWALLLAAVLVVGAAAQSEALSGAEALRQQAASGLELISAALERQYDTVGVTASAAFDELRRSLEVFAQNLRESPKLSTSEFNTVRDTAQAALDAVPVALHGIRYGLLAVNFALVDISAGNYRHAVSTLELSAGVMGFQVDPTTPATTQHQVEGARAAQAPLLTNPEASTPAKAPEVKVAVPRDAPPVIGITVDMVEGSPRHARVNNGYLEAVRRAGATPLLIPPMDEASLAAVLPLLDGVLFIGSADYHPELYTDEPVHPEVDRMSPERQAADLRIARALLLSRDEGGHHETQASRPPILGICGGLQLINIVRGGSLIQHVPDVFDGSVVHNTRDGWTKGWNTHDVLLDEGSQLREIYGEERIVVVTSHHQAAKKVGAGLSLVGRAPDGCPEAIEGPRGEPFLVGLQWHPERDYTRSQKLFEAFVDAAKSHRRRR